MIKEANFSKIFSDSSQMMLKLSRKYAMGRNLVKLKKLMTSSLIRKYDILIVILMSQHLGSGKSSLFLCFWMD